MFRLPKAHRAVNTCQEGNMKKGKFLMNSMNRYLKRKKRLPITAAFVKDNIRVIKPTVYSHKGYKEGLITDQPKEHSI